MKNTILVLTLILSITSSFAQINTKTYSEHVENGFIFYGDNNEPCEVSVRVKFNLKNLKSSAGEEKVFVLPPNSKRNKLSTLNAIKQGKKYSFTTNTSSNYGNDSDMTYDKDYEYYLPYVKGENIQLYQGYNGNFSHQNKKQLDFKMPIGTPVVTARGGIVINIVDHNSKTCPTSKCKDFANYIIISHDDGTFAEYAHIKRKGAKVKVGEQVKAGQLIALSGNVGWSTGPHLHFSVFFQRLNSREYLTTKFKIEDGNVTKELVEKEFYIRNYD